MGTGVMSMIISFAKTKQEIIDEIKWSTRRMWTDEYAKRFRAGAIVQAYDRGARNGGKRLKYIRLERLYKQWLHEMTAEDLRREGGRWKTVEEFMQEFGGDYEVWVVDFSYDLQFRKLEVM